MTNERENTHALWYQTTRSRQWPNDNNQTQHNTTFNSCYFFVSFLSIAVVNIRNAHFYELMIFLCSRVSFVRWEFIFNRRAYYDGSKKRLQRQWNGEKWKNYVKADLKARAPWLSNWLNGTNAHNLMDLKCSSFNLLVFVFVFPFVFYLLLQSSKADNLCNFPFQQWERLFIEHRFSLSFVCAHASCHRFIVTFSYHSRNCWFCAENGDENMTLCH